MRKRHLNAIREARQRNVQLRMIFAKMFERFLASGDDC